MVLVLIESSPSPHQSGGARHLYICAILSISMNVFMRDRDVYGVKSMNSTFLSTDSQFPQHHSLSFQSGAPHPSRVAVECPLAHKIAYISHFRRQQ